jgi:hypothetical protein
MSERVKVEKKPGNGYIAKDNKGNSGYGNTENASLAALKNAQDSKKK